MNHWMLLLSSSFTQSYVVFALLTLLHYELGYTKHVCTALLLHLLMHFVQLFYTFHIRFFLRVCDYFNLWKPKSSMPDYLFYPCRVSAC